MPQGYLSLLNALMSIVILSYILCRDEIYILSTLFNLFINPHQRDIVYSLKPGAHDPWAYVYVRVTRTRPYVRVMCSGLKSVNIFDCRNFIRASRAIYTL